MRNHATIVPTDSIAIVDGEPLVFPFDAPRNVHAIQWCNGKGHIEYRNAVQPNKPLSGTADYAAHVAPFVSLWETEKARLEAAANTPPALEEARAAKIMQIDAETSAAILAGFDCEVNGQRLHFSYDANDQQNFSDAANASVLAKLGVPGVPAAVTWNGWKIGKDDKGSKASRSLVRLTLTPESFLALYTGGALPHKATQMETGRMRKAAAERAKTLEALEDV